MSSLIFGSYLMYMFIYTHTYTLTRDMKEKKILGELTKARSGECQGVRDERARESTKMLRFKMPYGI